jgi:formate-dependent nitrite reductase cytochrome c552 subunit
MKIWFLKTKATLLAVGSAATLVAGSLVLESCSGSGGPIISGGGGAGSTGGIQAQFVALEPTGQAGATYVGPATCGKCHNGQNGSSNIYTQWQGTVHFTKNVTCENCHGPGSKHAAAPTTANILTYPNSNSYIVCAQCHGKEAADWLGSPHAQLVTFPIQDSANDPAGAGKTERCIVCHSGLMRGEHTEQGDDVAQLPNSEIVNVANQTLNNVPYTASCATCHDPHMKTGNLTYQGSEAQLWHLTANTNTSAVATGTKAPSFTQFNQVCAECHNGWGADPSDNGLNNQAANGRPPYHHGPQYNMLMGFSGVDDGGYSVGSATHATMAGQCTKCHMPNNRHTFTVSYDTSCTPCHTATDAANRAATIQAQTEAGELQLLQRLQSWSSANYSGNTGQWDYPGNGSTADETSVPIQIKRARHNYYFILYDQSYGPHNAKYTNLLLQVANQNLDAINVATASPINMTTAQMKQVLRNLYLAAAAQSSMSARK